MTDPNPYANPAPSSAPLTAAEEKQWAILAHVLGIFFGIISAAVFFFLYRDRGPFVRHHVVSEWNFRLTQIILGGVVGSVAFVGWGMAFASALQSDGRAAGAIAGTGITIFVVCWFVMLFIQVIGVVFGIIASVRASTGARYSIPLAVPFVKP